MKKVVVILIVLILGIAAFAWRSSQPSIDSSNKLHTNLYEKAIGAWDPKMEVLAFERNPSTMLTLRWQPPEATYNHFVITISQADGTLVRKESGEHDRVSLDPDALEPGTEYVFALQACLDPRCEEWLIAKEEYRGSTAALKETSQ